MRILYSHYLADEDHAAVRMVHAIARQLRELEHEVVVHRNLGSPVAPTAGVTAAASSGSFRAFLKGRLWFAKALERNREMMVRDRVALASFRPDVVLARQDAYCVSMAEAARKAGVPLVTFADAPVACETRTYGGSGRWHPPGLVERLERRVLRQSLAVITPSHPAAEELAKYESGTPIHVVPNGVDPDQFPEATSALKREAQRSLGLPEGSVVVGYQGTFRPFHGISLLRDLILAAAARPGLRWLVVGDGPDLAGLREAVAGRAPVTFLGRQPPERMGALMSAMDVGVYTPTSDSGPFYFCPLKVLEYAAAGCAVLAGKQGDIPLLLEGGKSAVLVEGRDVSTWSSALGRLLDDPGLTAGLGRAARRRVLDEFTWRHTAERIVGVLFEALEGSSLRTRLTSLAAR